MYMYVYLYTHTEAGFVSTDSSCDQTVSGFTVVRISCLCISLLIEQLVCLSGFRLRPSSCFRVSAYPGEGGVRSVTVWHFTAQPGVLHVHMCVCLSALNMGGQY